VQPALTKLGLNPDIFKNKYMGCIRKGKWDTLTRGRNSDKNMYNEEQHSSLMFQIVLA
jgi:hypothetical protein